MKMDMVSFFSGRKKPSLFPIIIGVVVVLLLISLVIPKKNVENEFVDDGSVEKFTEDIIEDKEFFIRIQVDGYTVETLSLDAEEGFVSTNYVESSDNPYIWPSDVNWAIDDLADEDQTLITLTVPGSPNISTVLNTPKFSVTTTGDSENPNTIVVVSSSAPGTFMFQYGERCYYFSVVS